MSIGELAQLIAAIGVMLSMLTVAKQISDNTKQARLKIGRASCRERV